MLTHDTGDVAIKLTFDPAQPLYSISITQGTPLETAPVFAMQFQGAQPISIATDRHRFSDNNRTVTVTDSGFGNVLNGLQFGQSAAATLGGQTVAIPLAGAPPAVAAFRACNVVPSV